MAAPAARPAAAQHRAWLSAALGVGWHAGGRAPPALRRLPRAGRQGGESHRCHPGQQVGQGGGKGGPEVDPVGFDAGKKTKGVKYHVLVDTLGLLLAVVVHAAGMQDRDGAALVLDRRTRALFPFILAIFADAGYQGPRVRQTARRSGHWRIEIIKRSDRTGFVVEAKRWIVERTLAWISRNRRLARDFENLAATARALIYLAMIKLMLRRLARP